MALLQLTESRLPEIFPFKKEDGSTTHFNAQNAAILGYNQFGNGVCLVSHLPSSIRFVQITGNFQNHYVVFVDEDPGTELDFLWKVTYFLAPEEEPEEGEEEELEEIVWEQGDKGKALFDLDVLKQGLSDVELARLTKLKVGCEVRKAGVSLDTLSIRHRIEEPFEDIAELYTDDGENIAKGGNAKTTYIAADIWRGYFGTALTWFGKHTDEPPESPSTEWDGEGDGLPLNHPLAVLYGRLLKSGRKKNLPALNQSYYDDLNSGELDLYQIPAKNSVGASALTPHFAAVGTGQIEWDRIGDGVKEKTLFDAFKVLSDAEKIDIYNLSRFPKSSAALGAKLLDTLLEKAESNDYEQFLGSAGDKTRWKGDQKAALKEDKFVKSLIFEYVNGPQKNIGGLEYLLNSLRFKKALKKTHLHDWSPYVTTILDYEFQDKAAIGRIEDAYFARRVVTHADDGSTKMRFERIENDDRKLQSTHLGREEYVVIKTKNLREKTLRFSVVTGNEVMTGTTGEVLDLIQWKVKDLPGDDPESPDGERRQLRTQLLKSEFSAKVGDDTYLQNEFGVDYVEDIPDGEEAEFLDIAVAKIGFRRIEKKGEVDNVFDSWDVNLGAALEEKPATLQLEVWMGDEDPGTMLNFGPEDTEALPLPAETGFRFLDPKNTKKQFRIYGLLPKIAAPRIERAYFAKKEVAGTNVSFSEIGPVPTGANLGSWILGREVYVVVEAKNLTAEHVKIYVQSGDEVLLGELDEGHPLILQDSDLANPRLHVRNFFKLPLISDNPAAPGTLQGDDDLKTRIAPITNPYANMATDFTDQKAVFRIKLRPHDGRATFDDWSANIDGAADQVAFVNLRVQVSEKESADEDAEAVYCYYGAEREHEEAGCGSSEVFRLSHEVIFQDKPAAGKKLGKELSVWEKDGFSVWNREFYEIYDLRNHFNPYPAGGRNNDGGNSHKVMGRVKNANSSLPANPGDHFVNYYWIDENDKEHMVHRVTKNTIAQKLNGVITFRGGAFRAEPPVSVVTDYTPFRRAGEGVDAIESRSYPDGTVMTHGDYTEDDGDVRQYITYNPALDGFGMPIMDEVIQMSRLLYNSGGTAIDYDFVDTRRRSTKPDLYAGFLGALAKTGAVILTGGSCYPDGSSYPSQEHNNGNSVDSNYIAAQQDFVTAMWLYGFDQQIVGCGRAYRHAVSDGRWSARLGRCTSIHNSHMHSSNFQTAHVEDLVEP